MKRRKLDEIDLFKLWIVERGAELLVPTNEWEIVRYRGGATTSVIYVNKTGKRTFTGRAQSAWDAFKASSSTYRADLREAGQAKSAYRTSVTVRTIIERDGDVCFYCGEPFSETRPRTKEHLVARTHKGPDHISNVFLSCSPCNSEAGHLSAPEKIRIRDRKRRGRGSLLLADLRPHVEALAVTDDNPAYKALLERVDGFLHINLERKQEKVS